MMTIAITSITTISMTIAQGNSWCSSISYGGSSNGFVGDSRSSIWDGRSCIGDGGCSIRDGGSSIRNRFNNGSRSSNSYSFNGWWMANNLKGHFNLINSSSDFIFYKKLSISFFFRKVWRSNNLKIDDKFLVIKKKSLTI